MVSFNYVLHYLKLSAPSSNYLPEEISTYLLPRKTSRLLNQAWVLPRLTWAVIQVPVLIREWLLAPALVNHAGNKPGSHYDYHIIGLKTLNMLYVTHSLITLPMGILNIIQAALL